MKGGVRMKIVRFINLTLAGIAIAAFGQPGFAAASLGTAERGTISPALVQQAYLKASNTESGDGFGRALTMDGDTLVIAAREEDSGATGVNGDQSDNTQPDAGAVYVFVRDGAGWSQQAYLKASNAQGSAPGDMFGDRFGSSVSISGDTIVVGARMEDSNATGVDGDQTNNSARRSGAVYVFVRNGTSWSQQAYLKASNARATHRFGSSVSISGDLLVVGAPNENSSATGVNNDDGSHDVNPLGLDTGAAYVFVRNAANEWSQEAYLKASNTGENDEFGTAVSISGNTIVIGAPRENSADINDQNDDSANNAGAAYVFVRDALANWTQQAYLKASNPDVEDRFGEAVSISGDTIVVGAEGEDSNTTGINGPEDDNSLPESGAAYVFVRSGTSWSQQAYLKASNADAVEDPDDDEGDLNGDGFGESVAILGDSIVVGSGGEDSSATGLNGDQADNSTTNAGAAYLFVRNGATWSQQDYLKASNTGVDDEFGSAVTLSGDIVVVGAVAEGSNAIGVNGDQVNNSAPGAGATYVFGLGTGDNQPPVADDQNTSTNEDTALTIVLTGSDANGDLLTFAIDTGPSNGSLGTITPISNTSAEVTYTSDPDFNGLDSFTFIVNDGIADSAPANVDVQVASVNDPPSFSTIGDVTLLANETGDLIWATNISPGPANESDQIVMFDVANVQNPNIFEPDQEPAIDSSGRLTFVLRVEEPGEVTSDVTIVAFDDGGTENGGVFTSEPVIFTIRVIPAADLSIEKTSGNFFVDPGGTITYSIVVINNGPSEVNDAVVTDSPPMRLGNLSWTCTSQDDAFCGNPSGTGPINELVSFLSGDSVTFTLTGTLQDTSNEPITNTASVALPEGVIEIDPSNNSDSDTDAVGLFVDSFESVEPD